MKYFLATFLFFLPTLAFASTLTLVPTPANVGVGDSVLVTLSVTSADSVNAFSGTIDYPKNLVPLSISDGNSIISLWITSPTITRTGISFAGAVPGGFAGTGKLFSVIFRATSAGVADISLAEPEVLLNDGKGTPAPATAPSLGLSIAPVSVGSYVAVKDTIPPEAFTPLLEVGPDGKYYIDFSTVDKQSGVAPVFAVASSPYLLRDQNLVSDVEVRAVDASGNIRLETYPHAHLLAPYEEALLVGILVVVAVLVYWRFRSKRTI
jgi:hypothetical protein